MAINQGLVLWIFIAHTMIIHDADNECKGGSSGESLPRYRGRDLYGFYLDGASRMLTNSEDKAPRTNDVCKKKTDP